MSTGLYRTLLLSSVFAWVLAMVPGTAQAQVPEGVQVKPAIIEERVNPGGTYSFSVRVKNLADTEKLFYIAAQDIKGTDDEGKPLFAAEGEKTAYDLSAWVTFPMASLDMKAGEEVTIPFTVKIPLDASPGSHFASVFVSSDPPKLAQSGASVGFRVGNIVSLRITGEVTEEMRLREFSTEKLIYDAPPVTLNVRTENLGNVLLRPHGLIEITDMFGKQVGMVEVNDTAAAVFPGAEREYAATWEYDRFAFGRYQALAAVNYGDDGKKTLTAATSFWVLPVKAIAIALGALLAVVLLLYMTVKTYIRRKLREMGVDGSKKNDADYYTRKHNRSASRLVFVALTVFVFGVAFLVMLFLMFA